MSLHGPLVVPIRSGFPRVSGDEPSSMTTQLPDSRFSPRERG